ncbi:MAG TPA: triose-phosphate isomerase, partial [Acidimicrobiales bacterium]|nr:triose-phosphate isomerase [Acidimicrobiales bacterium]
GTPDPGQAAAPAPVTAAANNRAVRPPTDGQALYVQAMRDNDVTLAIGPGRTASAEDAQAVCGFLRTVVSSVAGADAAASVRIQYGGSVKPNNAAELMAQPDIDGALVGGASLDADDFSKIVRYRLG